MQMLLVFPTTEFSYHLRHEEGALNFFEDPTVLLDNSDPEYALRSPLFGVSIGSYLGAGFVKNITPAGVLFPIEVLAACAEGKGALYLEGKMKTEKPLVLEIPRKTNSEVMTTLEFPLELVSVENMFRRVNLRSEHGGLGGLPTQTEEPSKYPDALTNGKYMVYIHGYNTSGVSARGSQSNLFKRFHQLGSKARFVGVYWRGNPWNASNLPTPSDYHMAVSNGLEMGRQLSSHMNFIPDDANLTVLAHSLGNAVAGNAIANYGWNVDQYYIINGAITLEAYDASQTSNSSDVDDMALYMTENDWKPFYTYENGEQQRLFASNWHNLFPSTDNRSKLTWKNIFASSNLLSVAYNFYSPGDEVVENAFPDEKFLELNDIWDGAFLGRHAWVKQEIGKGGKTAIFAEVFDDVNGGWNFNDGLFGYRKSTILGGFREFYPVEAKNEITNEHLKTNPFHSLFLYPGLYEPAFGSQVAEDATDRELLLATGIPATSFAIAVNALDKLDPEERNFNMQLEMKSEEAKTAWPIKFPLNPDDWLHSDFKDIAIQFVNPLYQEMIDIAELDKD